LTFITEARFWLDELRCWGHTGAPGSCGGLARYCKLSWREYHYI